MSCQVDLIIAISPNPQRWHGNLNDRKKRQRVRSAVVRMIYRPSAQSMVLVLWLVVTSGNTQPQNTKTGTSKTPGSQVVTCAKDAQCPSGQRCGFTSGYGSQGKCVVPSAKSSCFDPGGRCGCDGHKVEIFCAVGSRMEYTSAPACFVGPCPRPCTEERGCGGSGLICQKGFCVKP